MRVELLPQVEVGALTRKRVGDHISQAIASQSCDRFRFAVAYMRLSGLDRLGAAIDSLVNRGGTVSGAVGIDDGVTSEEALRSLQSLSDNSTVFHSISGFIFHPKVYLASGPREALAIVGSSNLTRDGLYRNIEVSTAVHFNLDTRADQDAYRQFDGLLNGFLDTGHPNIQPLTEVLINLLVTSGRVKGEAQVGEPGPAVVARRGRSAPIPPDLATLFPLMSVPVAPPPLRRVPVQQAPTRRLPTTLPIVPPGTQQTFLVQLSAFDSSHRSGVPGTTEILIPHDAIPFFPQLQNAGRRYPDVYFDVVLNTASGRAIHGYRLWYYEFRATGTRIDEYRLRLDHETIDLSTPGGGDLLIMNRLATQGGISYEATILPQTDPTFPTFLARCNRIIYDKRWGII